MTGFDIAGLSPDQRSALSALLDQNGIWHDFSGPELQAPASETEMVELLIKVAIGEVDLDEPAPAPTGPSLFVGGRIAVPAEGDGPPLVIALRWRRFAAYVVESFAFAVIGLSLGTTSRGASRAFVALATWGSGIVLVALMGFTAGMWAFKMRVVVPPSIEPPGWRVALIRYLVVGWPGLVALLALPFTDLGAQGWYSATVSLWAIACFGPILFDPLRRGLHDRIAGTLVVDMELEQRR